MIDAREAPPPPSFLQAAVLVFDLSLGEMLWSRRTVFMALLVLGPVAIAAAVRAGDALGWSAIVVDHGHPAVSGPAIFGLMIWVFYVRFTVPVLGAFYGTALIADEVEDRTLTYLFTRPVSRAAVLLGKYLAYLVCTGLVVLPSVVLVYLLVVPVGGRLGEAFPQLVTDLGLLGIGLAVYGAVFAWVGARFPRPLLVGLVFVLGWEPAVLLFPGYLKRLTVAYHLQALVPHAMPSDGVLGLLQALVRDVPAPAVSLLSLLAILVIFLGLALRTVERREYVLPG